MSDSSGRISSYSVEEIVSVFNRIDGQLLDLHRCSSDDFLGLNAQFKGFYKEAKGISTSAGALFTLLSEGANRKLIASLEDFYEKISRSEKVLLSQLSSSISAIVEMRMTLEGVYIPLRNASQNVGTLRLLLTNLHLGLAGTETSTEEGSLGSAPGLYGDQRALELFRRLVQDVEHHINEVHRLAQLVREFSRSLEEVRARLEGVRQESERGIETVMSSVHHGLRLFAEKQEEAHLRIPEITEKSDSCSKSIAGIITNLQYQDIIRQKMEHIQTAHQSLIEDLQRVDVDESAEHDEYWLRMLVQIRDIAALQSAQLVGTNREYQQAIETIARHFREIAVEMEEIATLCRSSLRVTSESAGETSISQLLIRLQDSWKILGDLSLSLPRFWRDLERQSDRARELIDRLGSVHRSYVMVETPLRELSARALEQGRSDLSRQLESVLDDLNDFWNVVHHHKTLLGERRSALVSHEDALKGASPLWDDFRRGAERMHHIGISLANTERESTTLLAKIEQMSKKVSEDTRRAMQQIRYYDFFEKVISELVLDLNGMSIRIRDELKDSDLASDVSELRRLYTMASERRIHDEFVSSSGSPVEEGDVDLFGSGVIDDASLATDDDDDGFELF